MDNTASTIVQDILRDRESGAARLVAECKQPMYEAALALCGDHAMAEDLVFRTFERVLDRIATCRDESAFTAWMKSILRNEWLMSVRGAAVRNTTPAGLPSEVECMAEPDDGVEAVERSVDAALLRDAIDQLPADMREAILLRYFMGLPLLKTAKILAVPVGTINSRLHYARKALAARLGIAAKKPGVKSLLIALALAALTAVGAVGIAAIRSVAEPEPEEAEVVLNAKSTENTEGALTGLTGLPAEGTDPKPADPSLSSQAPATNHETNGDSPQQVEAITDNSNTNIEENTMNTQLVKSVAGTFAAAALAAASLAATQVRAEQNTLYYCGGMDAAQTSSLTGTGASQGWAETPGGTRMYAGMQSNATHVVFGDGVIRTVTASAAAPSGSTLVFSNCLGRIAISIPQYVSVPTVTIGSLEVVSGSEVQLPVWGGIKDSSAPGGFRRAYPTWAGDDWFIETGSSVKFHLNTACWAGFNCTAVIRGGAGSSLKAETVHYDTRQYTLVSNTLRLSGNLSGYSGDLVVGSVGDQPGFARMELVNEYSIPSDPPVAQTSYVVVTNGATLIVDQDWTSGRNRVWDFGSGEPSTIYVAEGKTVTIKGEVRGSVGFRKSGPGTLVLTKQSPISGACEVISGKVLLQGDAAALKPLFAVYGEYLDAPCGSYINTQYKPNNNTRIVMDLTVQGAREYWYGVWDRAYNNGSFLAANDGAAAGVVHFGFGNTFNNGPSLLSNGRHVVDFDKGVLWIDNAGKYEASSTGSFQLSNNLYLFLINNIGTPYVHDDEQGTIRMHSCQIYNNGSLVRDYVPALHNGAWCLYERCGRTYVANSGTGSFNGQLAVLEVGPRPGSVYYIR